VTQTPYENGIIVGRAWNYHEDAHLLHFWSFDTGLRFIFVKGSQYGTGSCYRSDHKEIVKSLHYNGVKERIEVELYEMEIHKQRWSNSNRFKKVSLCSSLFPYQLMWVPLNAFSLVRMRSSWPVKITDWNARRCCLRITTQTLIPSAFSYSEHVLRHKPDYHETACTFVAWNNVSDAGC